MGMMGKLKETQKKVEETKEETLIIEAQGKKNKIQQKIKQIKPQINSEENVLHNYNGSSLIIADKATADPATIFCRASLAVKRSSITHTIGRLENTLSAPVENTSTDIPSVSCTLNGSEIKLEFGLVFGEPLTLRGFITQKNDGNSNEPGNLINFVWQQDTQLGLVFANKEQELSPTFDD